MSKFKLLTEIIKLSQAKEWFGAKKEWMLEEIYINEEHQNCLCGKENIKEICIIKNKINGNITEVGNICVNKFLGISSSHLFTGIKKIKKDISKSLNSDFIEYAFEKNWINKWEIKFYLDTWRKRNLTERQSEMRIKINTKILLILSTISIKQAIDNPSNIL